MYNLSVRTTYSLSLSGAKLNWVQVFNGAGRVSLISQEVFTTMILVLAKIYFLYGLQAYITKFMQWDTEESHMTY